MDIASEADDALVACREPVAVLSWGDMCDTGIVDDGCYMLIGEVHPLTMGV